VQAANEPAQNWYVDGLDKMNVGITLLLTIGYFHVLFEPIAGPRGWVFFLISSGLYLWWLAAGNGVLTAVRCRIHTSHTDFPFRPPRPGRKALLMAAALMPAAVLGWFVRRFEWDLASAAAGIVLASMALFPAARTGLRRFYVLAGLSAVTGTVFAIPIMKMPHRWKLCGVVVGALWLASGCIAYTVERRRCPSPGPAS